MTRRGNAIAMSDRATDTAVAGRRVAVLGLALVVVVAGLIVVAGHLGAVDAGGSLPGIDEVFGPPAAPPPERTMPPRATLALLWLTGMAVTAIGLVGLALVIAGLWPDRSLRAAAVARAQPWRSALIGLVPALIGQAAMIIVPVKLVQAGPRPGLGLLAILGGAILAIGLGTAGRALGTRLLPQGSPLGQTLAGLVPLLLPLVLPQVGLPLVVAATAVGLGAWFRAGGAAPAAAA